MKNILITGVSSGIGLHTANYFLARGWRVFGSVRNELDAIALTRNENFLPLIFDVRDENAIRASAEKVADVLGGEMLDILVNNAGIAVNGPLMHVDIADFERQLDVNVTGTLRVSQAFLPLLGASLQFNGTPGKIVNIGSVSGKFTTPFLGPYSASKFALEAISDALRRELVLYKIPVSLIQPAATKSAIWEKGKQAPTYTNGTDHEGFERFREKLIAKEEKMALETDHVAKVIWDIAQSKKPMARYLITRNNLLYRVFFSAPDKMVDRFFRKIFEKRD